MRELRSLAVLFLKLGSTCFGGPAAHIAMMEEEVVRRRQWLSRETFLDLLGMANLIPGPNSTELAIHIGFMRAGWAGLWVAGICFILPAMLIVMAIAAAYTSYGTLPQAAAVLYGIKPVVVAVVAQAIWGLTKTAVKNRTLAFLALLAVAFTLLKANELAVLFGVGIAMAVFHSFTSGRPRSDGHTLPGLAGVPGFTLLSGTGAFAAGTAVGASVFGLWPLFLIFVKIGAVLYGSGYVLLAFLRADLVERLGWLTESQLLDSIAVGQLTPGPVFTSATFIGYVLSGPVGALVATAGIFLPAFFFVAISGPLVPKIRNSPVAGAFLDGVNVASLALMFTVTLELGGAALVDPLTFGLAVVSAILLIKYKVNSAWLVGLGAVAGLLAAQLGIFS